MKIVTSWDDGNPLDLKLAEILSRNNIKATFYIPIYNSEGRAVLTKDQVRSIDSSFEIGSHTHDHIYLPQLPIEKTVSQIETGKFTLEDYVGHPVTGFCYPGGKYNNEIKKLLLNCKITHARTVRNFYLDHGSDPFQIPTAIQFYPHHTATYWANFLKQTDYLARISLFKKFAYGGSWIQILYSVIEELMSTDKVFHIWGHSWEIEKLGLWDELDKLFEFISALNPETYSVSELYE